MSIIVEESSLALYILVDIQQLNLFFLFFSLRSIILDITSPPSLFFSLYSELSADSIALRLRSLRDYVDHIGSLDASLPHTLSVILSLPSSTLNPQNTPFKTRGPRADNSLTLPSLVEGRARVRLAQ